jgi:hypothetical protein
MAETYARPFVERVPSDPEELLELDGSCRER